MKAALFDLDGVIVDTAKYHYEAWVSIAQTLGYTLSSEKNEALKGVSRDQSIMRILDWSGATVNEETFQSLLKKKNRHYLSLVASLGTKDVLPGVLSFLETLQYKKISIGLGSARKNACHRRWKRCEARQTTSRSFSKGCKSLGGFSA